MHAVVKALFTPGGQESICKNNDEPKGYGFYK